MKKTYITALFCFFTFSVFAQEIKKDTIKKSNLLSNVVNSYVPNVLPPSPNAASLGKFGETPVSLNQGVPSISIPIYQIVSNHLSVPITVDYHAGGIKVEEVAGFVGLGWGLNSGGLVSRTAIDRPDDEYDRGLLNNAITEDYFSPNIDQSTLFVRYDYVQSNKLDKQPDIFYFNFLGNSGKFTLRKGHLEDIQTIENKNIKIQLLNYQANSQITGFVITDNTGTQYVFEDKETQTVDETLNNTLTDESYNYTSSWYLSKIISPMGDVITFNYSGHPLKYYTKSSEYEEYRIIDANIPPPNNCSDGSYATSGIQTTKHEVNLQALKLSSIVFDKGQVNFYASPRLDLQQEYKLDSIEVCSPNQCGIKKFIFSYGYFDEETFGQSSYDNMSVLYANCAYKRLRLESIKEIGDSQTGSSQHSFTYYGGILPNRFSNAQDHWGFYNGSPNSSLLPNSYYIGFQNSIVNLGIASKEASLNNTLIGTLQSITYPTGGKSEFDFELHEVCHDSFYNSPGLGLKVYYQNFVANVANFLNFSSEVYKENYPHTDDISISYGLNATVNGLRINVVSSLNNSPEPETFGAVVIITGTNNSYSRTVYLRNIGLNNIYLPQGSYTVELRFTNVDYDYFNNITVNVSAAEYYQNEVSSVAIGGLRVKKIENFSQTFGVPNTRKEFLYNLDSSTNTCFSSGVLVSEPDYYTILKKGFSCPSSQTIPPENYYNYLTVFSRSNAPLTLSKGNPLGYAQVTVLDDALGQNGKTVHYFTTANDFPDIVDYTYNAPVTDFDFARGLETKVIHYENGINGYIAKRETNHIYTFHQTANRKAYMLGCDEQGRRNTALRASNPTILEFGCTMIYPKLYDITSGWLSKDSTIETTYEGAGTLVNRQHLFYQNNFILPTKTRQFNSDGKVFDHYLKYPKDLASSAVYAEMVDRNIISTVIIDSAVVAKTETEALNNNFTALSWRKVNYKKWFPTTILTNNLQGFFAPLYVESQLLQGNKFTELVFGNNLNSPSSSTISGYNVQGNVEYYQARDGINTQLSYYTNADIGKANLLKTRKIAENTTITQSLTYDYQPLVGVKSITDLNGYTSNFTYNALNQLQNSKDPQNYLLQDFFYHYQGDDELTGLGIIPSNSMNYVVSRTAREAQTGNMLDSDVNKTSTQIQYLDGLGKNLGTVSWKATPDQSKDIVSGVPVYNAYGQVYRNVLPAPSNVNLGTYRYPAENLAKAFYRDDNAFAETIFEPSPLNRPIKQFGAGQAWRTADKFVEMNYLIAGTEVVKFDLNTNGNGANGASRYAANSLYNSRTISERGFWTLEIKDKQGRVVAKYQQLKEGFVFAITAYIYDDLGRLRYVIPPEIYKQFEAGTVSSFTENDDIFKEGIYGYHYDDNNKGRQTEKHIPGGGWSYSVFDKNDREVMFADDEDKAKGYWQFRKFDALSREIMGGLIYNIGSLTRSQIQTSFDDFAGESYETISSSGLLGYTNISFPSSYMPQNPNVMEVKYYDDYVWQTETAYNFQRPYAFHDLGLTKGLMTGMLSRNIETNDWLKSVNYFDYRGKLVQSWFKNHKGNIERSETQYRFNGEVLKMRLDHEGIVEIYDYETDHMGRKTSFKHTLNGVLKNVAKYDHDEIGRLQYKKLSPSNDIGTQSSGEWNNTNVWLNGSVPSINDHVFINESHTITIPNGQAGSAGSLFLGGVLNNFGKLNMGNLPSIYGEGDLQTVDYSYHIRGLRGINLDASGNLTNKIFSMRLGYEDYGFWDGNIGKQEWKSNIDNITRSFTYGYDGASRIKAGLYTSDNVVENYSLNNVNYDANGNITNLSRNGWKSNNTFGLIDNLNYTYQSNSNKILKVDDASNETASFKDVSGNDYTYWADGSLKSDANKGITLIEYNYLKRPKKYTFSNGSTLENQYDATGKKLKSISSDGTVYDFVGNTIYKNNVLYQISHDEGRIIKGEYEYEIKDHLGNLRVAFRDSLGIAKITQKQDYDIYGSELQGLSYTKPLWNQDNFKFLGRESIAQTGCVDLLNRQYDKILGRFTSPDSVTDGQESQSLFQYSWNNPVLLSDPDGLMPCCGEQSDMDLALKGWNSDFRNTMDNLPTTILSVTDANDATVLVTMFTRGSNAINVDGTRATTLDKVMATAGAAVPFISGSAAKKILTEGVEMIGERAVGAYKTLQGKFNEAHHIIQDAAAKNISGYSKRDAPTIHLQGSSKINNTEHNLATQTQNSRRQIGDGGTYGSERRIAYRSLRSAGLTRTEAKQAVRNADSYFQDLGVTTSTTTRIPYKR